MPTTDRTIRTSHGTISVRDSGGNGLPIVLIHGLSCSKDVFVHQFEGSLARDFRLIAVDLPGHGASSDAICPEETYSVAGYADAVVEVLEFLGVEQVVAVGSSLGGQIALEMMASFPGIVGVMLAGAAPLEKSDDATLRGLLPHPDTALLGQRRLDTEEAAKLREMLAGACSELRMAAAIARADGRARAMVMEDLLAGDVSDCRDLVETARAPIAIINGACDPIIDNEHVARSAAGKVWEENGRILPQVGHMPFAEVPEIFNHLLKVFARDAQHHAAANENGWGLSLSA